MSGLFNTAHWSPDFDNAANQKFVAEFQKEYKPHADACTPRRATTRRS